MRIKCLDELLKVFSFESYDVFLKLKCSVFWLAHVTCCMIYNFTFADFTLLILLSGNCQFLIDSDEADEAFGQEFI